MKKRQRKKRKKRWGNKQGTRHRERRERPAKIKNGRERENHRYPLIVMSRCLPIGSG